MTKPHELSALEQAAAVRSGELGPVELVDHHLDRIAEIDERIGAFLTVTADSARAQARAAEHRLRSGTHDLPPLFGVPTAIKDLAATAGVRTTFGSRAYRDFVPAVDAHCVTLLRAAGTISLGKTNTPEFGLSAYTDNDLAGTARSPWALDRSAGGSSGGSAAAVAAGLVPFAHGTDGGGSLRIPASACGIFGLKPGRGRISNGPLGVDPTGMMVHGPLARTVRDAAALLDALAVPMPGDPHWAAPLPPGESFVDWAGRDPGRLRIARYAELPDFPLDPACRTAYDEATALLLELGHEVEEIAPPFGIDLVEPFRTTWAVRSLQVPVAAQDEDALRPITRWWRASGRAASAADLLAALSAHEQLGRRAVAATADYDAVLSPTMAMPPQPPAYFTGPADLPGEVERQTRFSPYTGGHNVSGQPAASVPLHWTAAGLPIGVMLAGRPAGEGPLLALCAQLESARPWARWWPPCSRLSLVENP